MIPVAASVRIWIASDHTDMRKGMYGLALLVQEGLGRDPFAGDVFVFHGRAGSLNDAPIMASVGITKKLSSQSRKLAAPELISRVRIALNDRV
jgi:transposase